MIAVTCRLQRLADMVPEGWKVPRPSLMLFYILRRHGYYESERIQCLKFLCRFDVSRGPDWTQVTRCTRVIDELERLARENGLTPADSDLGTRNKMKR